MTRIYLLRYPKDTSNQPIIYHLVQRYVVEFNILKADIRPQRDGIMVVELKGQKEKVADALDYLKGLGVKAERLAGKVHRDESKCFQCGACTGICPVGALYIQRPSMEVIFDPEKCTACGLCVAGCPVRSMKISFDPLTETGIPA
ncbi:MAG: NIL domain-containing protein [Candidatus Electrothrix sp. GW3-4]|uniref:NIL domain-containing protein n=1 Tax=Candidatus Electrothrix sp. GW3-4 TaxID=3126740 RepID=UPI0030CCABDA